MVLRKLFATALIIAACTAIGAQAQAQTQPWPSRAVRIVESPANRLSTRLKTATPRELVASYRSRRHGVATEG